MAATLSEISCSTGVILDGPSMSIGHIIQRVQGADAQQESRSSHAVLTRRANPILLIDENDVTAGHAASIGQVDPEDIATS